MTTTSPDIAIVYFKNSLDREELISIENELANCDLMLAANERSPYINASIDFFVPFIQILLSPDMINALCQGLLTSAACDAIRALLMRMFKKFSKEPAFKLQGGNITKEVANIHFVMGKNVLALPMNVDEERFKYVVDKFVEASVTSNPAEVTYTFLTDNGNVVMRRTEAEIIQEEYEKQLRKKNNKEQEVRYMPRDEHHVVPNSERGGWDVKRNNASRASGHYDTKAEAMKAGREMSRNQGTEFIPHRKDGTIQNPDSHGNDPCPPKDKR